MANFNAYIPLLRKIEGGFVNDPDDPGGATNKGITLKTFEIFAQSLLGIEPTLENLKALTDSQAAKIFKVGWWNKMKGNKIKSQDVAEIVIDHSIHSNRRVATKMAQRVMNRLGQFLVDDGVFGTLTLKAINTVNPAKFHKLYKKARIEYYKRLTDLKPRLRKFLPGWINRANKFEFEGASAFPFVLLVTAITVGILIFKDEKEQVQKAV